MTQTISRQKKPAFTPNYEEDNWDDIEFPETGLLLINNNNDYGLSTTTRDMSGITISDSSDDDSGSEEEEYFSKLTNYNSNKSTPASSSTSSTSSTSSINKVKEMMINSGVVTNNKKEFSGLITRIGGENNKVIAVGDDWDNDMEIPEDGFANLTITNRSSTVTNDFEFDSWDEEEQSITTKNSITSPRGLIVKRIEDPSKVLSKSNIAPSKALESFDDDFDFSEVDLKLSAEALKLYEEVGNINDKDPFESERYSSRDSSRLSILQSPAPTNSSQSAGEEEEDLFDDIQFPEHMDSLTLISYNDDDNFENGLDIDDESVFAPDKLKNKNIITRPNPTQQRRTRRESFTIEFTTPKNSRSSTPSISLTKNKVHPKTTGNNSSPVSSLYGLKTNLGSLKTSTTTTNNTSKSTFSKNPISRPKSPQISMSPKIPVKEIVKKKPISLTNMGSTSTTSKPSSKKIVTSNSCTKTKSTLKTNSMPTNNRKRSQQNINPKVTPNITTSSITPNANLNTISTLEVMRKPKRQHCFGDGSELDGFDDLPISIDRERSYTASNYTRRDRKSSVSSVGSSDNHQRHRKHKKNRKKKKPQLIRNLNADKNPKVVGEMVYNPITQRWDGNDSVLKDFDNVLTSPTRPALISNMNNHTINTKSFQIVGKMKFDPIKMCWNRNNDSSDDDEEIWAKFDYDDPTQEFNDNDTSIRKKNNDFQVGSEFDITPGFLAALLASERQHRNEITKWYPDALSKKNYSRFGLKDVTLQRSYLYDLRNKNNRRNAANNSSPSSGNNSKAYHNRSGGLFEAAMNLTRHERRHFR